MSVPRISIVLPVYNVSAYLPKCLDSLAEQILPADEIIAVNDGSTDNSLSILSEYSYRMPNLSVINQENGGQSVARNTGIDASHGEWLMFVDADDFLEPDALLQLATTAEENNLGNLCITRPHDG